MDYRSVFVYLEKLIGMDWNAGTTTSMEKSNAIGTL
jgi:hypothetical protein